MLKQSLQLRQSQRLAMTPQLRQAIRLLQLSTLELRQEINEALESNMMLELADENGSEDTEPDQSAGQQQDAAGEDPELPDELPVDAHWEDIYEPPAGPATSKDSDWDPIQQAGNAEAGLREHLSWQTEFAHFSPTDMAIATALIDAIDDDGYLHEDLDTIRASLPPALAVDPDEVEAVLHRLQCLDPPGVFARDPAECLRLQLRDMDDTDGTVALARDLVDQHLEAVASGDMGQLAKRTGASEAALARAVSLIRTLDPHPGSRLSNPPTEYITPDVFVFRGERGWEVALNPATTPRLRINPLYSSLAGEVRSEQDSQTLRDHTREARWFIKSLQSRNQTLLQVARRIVERQQDFLEHGEEAMKPMILREIAEAVEMHESTISRVTTRKYMHTPRGIFEFKYFFSSHVSTADGGECSATAIHAIIRRLIAGENPRRPLSDSKLTNMISEQGINVARRTVAKYREAMGIPSSSDRRNTF